MVGSASAARNRAEALHVGRTVSRLRKVTVSCEPVTWVYNASTAPGSVRRRRPDAVTVSYETVTVTDELGMVEDTPTIEPAPCGAFLLVGSGRPTGWLAFGPVTALVVVS